jgi:hypothetical protein
MIISAEHEIAEGLTPGNVPPQSVNLRVNTKASLFDISANPEERIEVGKDVKLRQVHRIECSKATKRKSYVSTL